MRILVTGSNGFIGKNLKLKLQERLDVEVFPYVRGDSDDSLHNAARCADAVVHLAGENRPANEDAFEAVNAGLTRKLCDALCASGNRAPVLLASSAQAELNNPYGRSKLAAECAVDRLSSVNGNPVAIFRLPGVFGKWCKPNYNSVVATFCHNVANDLPLRIDNAASHIRLVYVDDVVASLLEAVQNPTAGVTRRYVAPEYEISLSDLAHQIEAFKNCRNSLVIERVGTGLTRALYATYVSYLPRDKFAYDLPAHGDARGVFVEMLKTHDSGQISFFTAHPGITRGGHYHHTKTEKFLVINGKAKFRFRHMMTNEMYCIEASSDRPQVVETVPGWAHDVTNIGSDQMIVMLWANEIFDRDHPDTIASEV